MEITYKSYQKVWLILLPLCFFLFYDFLQMNMMNSLSSSLIECLKITMLQLGEIAAVFFYINLLLLYPAGLLLDRFHVKLVVVFSLFFTLGGTLIFTLTPSALTLVEWRALSGVAGAFSYLSCVKILATYFPRKILGLYIGLTGIVIMLAGVVAQYPLVLFVGHFGLKTTLIFNIVLGATVISFLLIIPKKIPESFSKNYTIPTSSNTFWNIYNWFIGIYAALNNLPLFVLGALWGNVYLQHTHSMSIESASVITSMIFFGNMLGAPLLGFFSDRMRDRKKLILLSSLLMLGSCAITLMAPVNTNVFFIGFLFFLMGIATGSQTLAYALIVDINKSENTAQATSILSFLSVGLGALAQPLFVFVSVYNKTTNFQNGMLLLLVSAFLSVMLAIYFCKKSDIKLAVI
jgi:MFS family permease